MTHPHEPMAKKALELLLDISGVFAVVIRAQADAPRTPTEIRTQVERAAEQSTGLENPRAWIESQIAHATEHLKTLVRTAPPPFPHLTEGTEDLAHYLSGLTDLLGPGYDDRIDARIGATRMVSESWDYLIVAVAVPVNGEGNKSLSRGLRRARRKVEKL